jgi:hypothetical protein
MKNIHRKKFSLSTMSRSGDLEGQYFDKFERGLYTVPTTALILLSEPVFVNS